MFTFDHLTFRYRDYLFEDYSGLIPEHKVGIVGRNGSGKTTLLKLIDHQLQPEQGSLRVDGSTYLVDFDLRRYQQFTMDDLVTLCAPLESFDVAGADHIASLLHANDYRHIPIGELSTGVTKKAALLMGLLSTARVLLVDEPFESLDAETNEELTSLLRQQARAVVVVSHDQELLKESVEVVYRVEDRQLVRTC